MFKKTTAINLIKSVIGIGQSFFKVALNDIIPLGIHIDKVGAIIVATACNIENSFHKKSDQIKLPLVKLFASTNKSLSKVNLRELSWLARPFTGILRPPAGCAPWFKLFLFLSPTNTLH